MDDEKRDYIRRWLTKARRDLESARWLGKAQNPDFFETIVYHCQQTAEKAVKAYLVFQDQEIEKTHNVTVLVRSAIALEPRFASLVDAAESLTPYAVRYRYPGAVSDPTEEECAEAVETAGEVYTFVLSLLPEETHPDD
jgi:HEPN domain-containing protein